MIKIFKIKANDHSQEIGDYTDLNDFIDNFPFTERQCIIHVERELLKNGFFNFSDFDSPLSYQLLIIR